MTAEMLSGRDEVVGNASMSDRVALFVRLRVSPHRLEDWLARFHTRRPTVSLSAMVVEAGASGAGGELQLNLGKAMHKRRKRTTLDPSFKIRRPGWIARLDVGLSWKQTSAGVQGSERSCQMQLHASDRRFDFLAIDEMHAFAGS